MTNLIRVLEKMGSNPSPTAADYAATVSALDLDASQKRALLQTDPAALNGLLAGRHPDSGLFPITCYPSCKAFRLSAEGSRYLRFHLLLLGPRNADVGS